MSLRHEATQAAFWGIAQKWGHHGVRLCVFVVLARLLGPDSFGLVALASVFILLGETLVDQGFGEALVQRERIGRAHLDSAFWATVVTGVALAGLAVAAAPLIAAVFGQPDLGPVLAGLAPSLILASLCRVQESMLRRALVFRKVAGISLLSTGVGGVAGLAVAFTGGGVWSLVVQFLVQRAVQLPCLWLAVDWWPRARFSPPHFRALLRFGANVMGINVLNFANRQADHLLIGYVLGPTALGYYTIAYRLIRILFDLLPQAVTPVAFAAFSRLQREPARLREAFYEATQAIALFAFPAFTGLAILAPAIIPACFGPGWAASVPVLQVLAPIGMLQSLSVLYQASIKAVGRPGHAFGITAANAVANVIGFSIAVQWGVVAVALAYSVRGFLLWPVSWGVLRRAFGPGAGRYAASLATPFGATVAMAAAVVAARPWLLSPSHEPLTGVIAGVPLGVATYLLALVMIAPDLCRHVWRRLARRTHASGVRP